MKANEEAEEEDGEENDEGNNNNNGGGCGGERQREHPFIVTEPGEVARGKKNGLDYLFHLYEQCREFLIQVQAIAKDRGEKCPTKVVYLHLFLFFLNSLKNQCQSCVVDSSSFPSFRITNRLDNIVCVLP